MAGHVTEDIRIRVTLQPDSSSDQRMMTSRPLPTLAYESKTWVRKDKNVNNIQTTESKFLVSRVAPD
jgi:hypothetical protein